MRRLAYPYGRYVIKDAKLPDVGLEAKHFLEHQGFSVIKYDEQNDGAGVLVIGVNKTILEHLKQKKPMGRLQEFFYELTSLFSVDLTPLRDIDENSQRVGIEIYLWPFEKGILLEVFILPYMEMMNKAEICRFIDTPEEELTDWYLSEEIWEEIEPKIVESFKAKPVKRRS